MHRAVVMEDARPRPPSWTPPRPGLRDFRQRFSDDDWRHAAGGWRAFCLDGRRRWPRGGRSSRMWVGNRSRAGYVEAVATRAGRQDAGAGSAS